MKYSAHKINVRTIRNMAIGETILLKHGKRVTYKGGFTLTPNYYDGCCGIWNAEQAMNVVREWTRSTNNQKTVVIIIKRVNEYGYDMTIARHFSTKDFNYYYYTTQFNYKKLEV